jgi:hypothetical protein
VKEATKYLWYLLGFYHAVNKEAFNSGLYEMVMRELRHKQSTKNTADWLYDSVQKYCKSQELTVSPLTYDDFISELL